MQPRQPDDASSGAFLRPTRRESIAPLLLGCLILLLLMGEGRGAAGAKAAAGPVCLFTDQEAVIAMPGVADGTKVTGELTVLGPNGWGPRQAWAGGIMGESLAVKPPAEGLQVLTLREPFQGEKRFLALAPPAAMAPEKLRRALPRSATKLLSGQPYRILAMGDSVTSTGDFSGMLALLLARATDHPGITVINRSYPGRSVDASVRNFPEDALATRPDLALIMYGLNDQAAGSPLAAYLEQYAWLARHLAADCGADVLFLTPTPDISAAADGTIGSSYAFRTIAFAEALRPLATELDVPLVDAFQALWGSGGATLTDAVHAMWPRYPLSYAAQFSSMLESDGKGDGIHPNALGHLAMAKAVLAVLAGTPAESAPLAFRARSEWTTAGLVAQVTVANATGRQRTGTLTAYPLPGSEDRTELRSVAYELGPGREHTFSVAWPGIRTPADLLGYPVHAYLEAGPLPVVLVDASGATSRVYSFPAPLTPGGRISRGRWVVTGDAVKVPVSGVPGTSEIDVRIPQDQEVGRVPLLQPWDAAELAFVRFGQALAGDATVDGYLNEWRTHAWFPVGETVQARWVQGRIDRRATPDECHLRVAVKAGATGLYLALRCTGEVGKDTLHLFFDPRTPEQLGTPGRYFWCDGTFAANGVVTLKKGETSRRAAGLRGTWKATPSGRDVELFVPYELMETRAWPAAGDLGLSLWWAHVGPQGEKTSLLWAEDGHPWSPRWYGVVRLVADGSQPLPYRVRVK